jgi:cytochrome oxidase Cu insertion factor (SCO1/SenC/PrrC family)
MKSAVLATWLMILILAVVSYGVWRTYQDVRPDAFRTTGGTPQPAASKLLEGKKPEFILTERSGKEFSTNELDGKVWVVSFFFANCARECVQQNRALAQLQKDLGGRDIRFVSITCDPIVDTPQKLRQYADGLGADPKKWLFLTGRFKDIQEIAQNHFLLALEERSHSARAIVLDRDGKIRDVFSMLDADEVSKMQRRLIELHDSASERLDDA